MVMYACHSISPTATRTMPLSFLHRRKALLQRPKEKRCFKMIHLAFGALPTIVFGVFTIVYTQQQHVASQMAREQDQRQADENNRRILFKEYIDDIKELLLDGDFEMKNETLLIHIRVRTLTVLKSLNLNASATSFYSSMKVIYLVKMGTTR